MLFASSQTAVLDSLLKSITCLRNHNGAFPPWSRFCADKSASWLFRAAVTRTAQIGRLRGRIVATPDWKPHVAKHLKRER